MPQLRSDDILGGSFCATDGFVDPYSVMKGFMAAAAERGARLWRSVEVTGIDVDATGVAGVAGWLAGEAPAGVVAGFAGATGTTTVPLMSDFCFLPIVWRAARVAFARATAFTLLSTVRVAFLGGANPKSSA